LFIRRDKRDNGANAGERIGDKPRFPGFCPGFKVFARSPTIVPASFQAVCISISVSVNWQWIARDSVFNDLERVCAENIGNRAERLFRLIKLFARLAAVTRRSFFLLPAELDRFEIFGEAPSKCAAFDSVSPK